MPFNRWIISLVFGLITFSLQAQEQAESAQKGTAEQEEASNQLPLGFPVRIIENDEASKSRESRERKREEREEDELIAQKQMAEATIAMNLATQSMKNAAWWSFGVVSFGTALLIWTLILTRQANLAGQAAVEVTRKVGNAQVRAYVTFTPLLSEIIADGEGTFLGIRFQMQLKNTGASPAIVDRAFINIIKSKSKDVVPDPDINFSAAERPIHLGAGVLDQFTARSVSVNEVMAIADGAEYVFIFQVVKYRTVFDEDEVIVRASRLDIVGTAIQLQESIAKKSDEQLFYFLTVNPESGEYNYQ